MNVRDPHLPVCLASVRALQDEVARLDVAARRYEKLREIGVPSMDRRFRLYGTDLDAAVDNHGRILGKSYTSVIFDELGGV